MKLTDFGLWFRDSVDMWSTTIPPRGCFYIYYDGNYLGSQHPGDRTLIIYNDGPYTINLKKNFSIDGEGFGLRYYTVYSIGRLLTLDDFEIVENPHYRDSL